MSRAAQLDCQHGRSCALVLTLFLFQKGQGFFPPLPIAALPRRSWREAYAPLAGWDASMRLGHFAARINGLIFFFLAGVGHAYPLQVGMLRCSLFIFAAQKASVKSKSRWPFKRAMRPVAEWRSESATRQGAVPDPRAVAPVVPRR